MKDRAELIKEQKKLLEVYENFKKIFSNYPNVINIGIGLKEKNGTLTSEGCIKVIVKEKKGEDELSEDEIIPKEFDGVKTDIVVEQKRINQAVCTEDQGNYRPIKGGIMINNVRNGSGVGNSGTLGCVAQLNSDDSWVLLTNHHVLYGTTGQDNDEIGQPWVGCSWCCKTNVIAKNENNDPSLDCAIAKINGDIAISNIIEEIVNIQGAGAVAAVNGERLRKRGARTGLTSGTISFIDPVSKEITVTPKAAGGPVNDPGGCTNYESGVTVFTYYGDSGSVYVNDNNEVVGLHYAGNNNASLSFGNDIIQVQTSMGITIKTTSTTPGRTPSSYIDTNNLKTLEKTREISNWMSYVEERLEKTQVGRQIQNHFRKHEIELFNLVNKRRPVTVVWQRKQGPAFIAAIGRSFKHPEYEIPSEINRVSPQNLLMSMATIMEEHGSESLRKDIAKFTLPIIQFVKEYKTVKAMLHRISEIDKESKILTNQEQID